MHAAGWPGRVLHAPPEVVTYRSSPSCRGRESWQHGFVQLEKIVMLNLPCLFAGMSIESAHIFRVTRNAEARPHNSRS
jgi:polyphosphate kinase